MKKLPKPTYEELMSLKAHILNTPPMEVKYADAKLIEQGKLKVEDVEKVLSASCGDSVGAIQKRMLPRGSKSWRDTPASVWRCWCLDFYGFDIAKEL